MKRLFIHPASYSRYVLVAIFISVLALGTVIVAGHARAADQSSSNERLITIHDRGKDRGILTTATTLRGALKEASIAVDKNDLVEPGLDEVLVASSYQVNIYRARPVIIVDGVSTQKVLSPYQTSKQIVEHAGLELQNEDVTAVEPITDVVSHGAGLQVTIDRAIPFTLLLYGKQVQAYTQQTTVEAMLKEKGIKLGAEDTLSVSKDAVIASEMTVEIWRNGKQTVTEEQSIAFPIEKVQDADREVGYREVKTTGVNGKKNVTYEVVMKNGKEESRVEIQSMTTSEPVKQVEIVGSKLKNTFNGSFAEALARLRSCEGSYTSNTGNGYYGAYQFDRQTWGNYGGFAVASDAPASVQDEKAWTTYQRRGWQPWPSCSRSQGLQDIYR